MVTFVQATFSSWHLSISGISRLLLTRFWWIFKGRFLWTFRTYSNCQGDICPRNICPRDICPYQEYLSCYWPDFDETLQVGSWEHLEQIPSVTVTFVQAIFVLVTFVHIRNISAVTVLLAWFWPKFKDRILGPSLTDANCFVEATNVLTRLVHISNISAVTDPILTIKARSRQGQSKVKARSKQGQGKVNARLRQG